MSTIVIHHRWLRLVSAVLLPLLVAATNATAQSTSQERTFHASKAEVQKALQDLHVSAAGKLPTLEGFAGGESLEKFQRGYYQYTYSLVPVDASNTTVRVSAKITAWYKGDTSANSGYRELTSNGRLESDFLDTLDDALKPAPGSQSKPTSAQTQVAVPESTRPTVPNAPSSSYAASSLLQSLATPTGQVSAVHSNDSSAEQRARQLIEQGNSFRDILHNQTRPANLAVIKTAKTPLLEKPTEGSKTVLLADAEDEFQIVDSAGDWVHVQVSGISRGWVRRDQVDMPPAARGNLSELENDPRSFERPPAFQQTHEEVSVFPGKWEPLDGKKVKIIWIQPAGQKSFGAEHKLNLVKSVLRKTYSDVSGTTPTLAGVVVILDSEDGGMAAATMSALQQWHAGHLPDGAFWKRCLLDPADAFRVD